MKTLHYYIITIVLALILSLITSTSFAWQETDISKKVPFPPNVKIVRPTDLPPEIAALSGRWEGMWKTPGLDDLPSMLIVEKIDNKVAFTIYAWGSVRGMSGGYQRLKAIVSSGKLEFSNVGSDYTTKFVFEISNDGKTLQGTRTLTRAGTSVDSVVTMNKIED